MAERVVRHKDNPRRRASNLLPENIRDPFSKREHSFQKVLLNMDIIEPIFKTIMNAEQIKGEIRTLSRTDKIEICRWIDEEAAIDPLFWIGAAENRTEAAWTPKAFVMSGRNAYHGVLGEVVFAGRNFFASKDGFRIGTESTLEEAMESLILRERFKDKMRDDLVEGGTSSVVYSGISTL